jgi:DNA-binding NarL/FixJ family response regulator
VNKGRIAYHGGAAPRHERASDEETGRGRGDRPVVVVVDDRPAQLNGLVLEINRVLPDWDVEKTTGPDDTLQLFARLEPRIPSVVSVDLGLDPDPDRPAVGLRLLRELRSKFGGVPLAVHTAQQVEARVLHEIVTIPASYVRIRDRNGVEAFVRMLPFLAEGFVVYSPSVASRLPNAIVVKPDPLEPDHWKVLALLAKGLTYEAVAETLGVTSGAIQARVTRMSEVLEERGFVEPAETETEQKKLKQLLLDFYRDNHVRYGH